MPLFLDASAWAKLYVQEEGTEAMEILFARPDLGDEFFSSRCVAVEMFGLFAAALRVGTGEAGDHARDLAPGRARRKVFRQFVRGADLKYREAVNWFTQDLRTAINLVEMDESILRTAIAYARTKPREAVQSMDWIHLSTALHLSGRLKREGLEHDVVMVASDRSLLNASKAAGLDTWNPETDPPSQVGTPRLLP